MWISKKKWNNIEQRVARLERNNQVKQPTIVTGELIQEMIEDFRSSLQDAIESLHKN